MTTQATLAVLVKNGNVIGKTTTTAKNGAVVSYGKSKLKNDAILEIGKAKISRAKKYLEDKELMYNLEMSNAEFFINHSNFLDA
jgi:hypothetical protein